MSTFQIEYSVVGILRDNNLVPRLKLNLSNAINLAELCGVCFQDTHYPTAVVLKEEFLCRDLQ